MLKFQSLPFEVIIVGKAKGKKKQKTKSQCSIVARNTDTGAYSLGLNRALCLTNYTSRIWVLLWREMQPELNNKQLITFFKRTVFPKYLKENMANEDLKQNSVPISIFIVWAKKHFSEPTKINISHSPCI